MSKRNYPRLFLDLVNFFEIFGNFWEFLEIFVTRNPEIKYLAPPPPPPKPSWDVMKMMNARFGFRGLARMTISRDLVFEFKLDKRDFGLH